MNALPMMATCCAFALFWTAPAGAQQEAPQQQQQQPNRTCSDVAQALEGTNPQFTGFWLGPAPVVFAREQAQRCPDARADASPAQRKLQDGLVRFGSGRFDESAASLREGVALADSDAMRIRLLAEAGKSLLAGGRTADARAAIERAMALFDKEVVPQAPRPVPLQRLGSGAMDMQAIMAQAQRAGEVEQVMVRRLQIQSELQVLMGLAQLQADDVAGAVDRLAQAHAGMRRRGDNASMDRGIIPPYLALALYRAGRNEEARALLLDALASREESLGMFAAAPQIAQMMQGMGMSRLTEGLERNMAAVASTSGELFLPSFACPLLETIDARAPSPERSLESAERCRGRALTQQLAHRAFRKNVPSIQEMMAGARRGEAQESPDNDDPMANPAAGAAARPASLAEMRAMAQQRRATVVAYSIATEPGRLPSRMPEREVGIRIWVIGSDGRVSLRERGFEGVLANQDESFALTSTIVHAREVFGVAGRGPVAVANARPQRVSRSGNELRRLHRLLVEPVAELLPPEPGARLVVVPQGALFLVPFAALEDTNGTPLVARYALSLTPSMQTLALTGARKRAVRADGAALVVGNPVMPRYVPTPGAAPLEVPSLPGAEEEARAVAELLHASPLTGAAATKPAVLQAAQDARYIHLATHGFLDDFTDRAQGEANPYVRRLTLLEDSGGGNHSRTPGLLALAPSASDGGMLTADEIAQARTQAELVVMSACDTGRGAINDEGVIGLSRAWMSAGVPSVVVSLWSIPDEPTRDLMETFYRRLQAGAGKSEALREAMQATRAKYPKTAYWAAFVLMGEPD
ncbi:CHAT domain-containing protein [Variovorax sp. OV329]|uniref:CHAT domain-containing protein n=1 Tax=Variovorax sp. OV329 TaxID=1882825 RepID=UPI0008E7F3CD|nr:CHAT domain-containing protein [Variovorax sp. OV329]SFM80929.1 CHAT domain-containing protein [Variovorax sp. OV329]